MPIFIAILIFGLVILVHELGHFIAARRSGVLVKEFAIGMGPKLIGKQVGETLYSLRILPLGGFCLMLGDDADSMGDKEGDAEYTEANALSDRTFNSKGIPQRMAIMFGGSFMNFVLAFVLFTLLAMLTGFATTTLHSVTEGSPAEAAGLMPGDRITSFNGSVIFLFEDISFGMATNDGRPVDLGFTRDGERHVATIVPEFVGDRYLLGIAPTRRFGLLQDPSDAMERATLSHSISVGFFRIGFFVRTTLIGLVRLVTAQLGFDQLAGPIGIVSMIGGQYQTTLEVAEAANQGTAFVVLSLTLTMLQFAAFISANLGVLNLLPFPALDGGRIIFLTIEAIRRKPIPPEREGIFHIAGFVLLMILAVFIAYQDILNIL